MRLPEVQRRLRELAIHLHSFGFPADPKVYADELLRLADAISRRKRVTQAPATARRMSPALKHQIIDIHYRNPELPHFKIAEFVGTNPGRVSEVLAGKRT